jgi:hypothetical protein
MNSLSTVIGRNIPIQRVSGHPLRDSTYLSLISLRGFAPNPGFFAIKNEGEPDELLIGQSGRERVCQSGQTGRFS